MLHEVSSETSFSIVRSKKLHFQIELIIFEGEKLLYGMNINGRSELKCYSNFKINFLLSAHFNLLIPINLLLKLSQK